MLDKIPEKMHGTINKNDVALYSANCGIRE